MADDRTLGGIIMIGSIAGIVIYFWLLFFSPWCDITIKISMFAAVGLVLLIIAWIGYTLATTPSPESLEDFDIETELPGEESEEEQSE